MPSNSHFLPSVKSIHIRLSVVVPTRWMFGPHPGDAPPTCLSCSPSPGLERLAMATAS